MFSLVLVAYSSLGHLLFVSMATAFHDFWSSMLWVTVLLLGKNIKPQYDSERQIAGVWVFIFMAVVFGCGLMTAYVSFSLIFYFLITLYKCTLL